MSLLSKMPCKTIREEMLWIRLVADLLRQSWGYTRRNQGGHLLRCEAILMAVEAFLRTHGPARGLSEGRILVSARQRAAMEPSWRGPALERLVWGDLAQLARQLAAFEDLEAGDLPAAKALAGITGAILARARSEVLAPPAWKASRDLVTPFG